MIARAAAKLGMTTEETAKRIINALAQNELPTTTEYTAQELFEASLADKKRSGDHISIVIPKTIGCCETRTIPFDQWKSIIEAGIEG